MCNDAYFKVNKTNHLINYNNEIPRYQGFRPVSTKDDKISRPYCLSTKRE